MPRTSRDSLRIAVRLMTIIAALALGACLLSAQNRPDERSNLLRNFFLSHHCRLTAYTGDFLAAADENRLDWRLLPSLAIVESGCVGRNGTNNIFGWKSGHARFSSIRASIHRVAARLANSPIYAGRDLRQLLRIYNSSQRRYGDKVLAVMNSLSRSNGMRT